MPLLTLLTILTTGLLSHLAHAQQSLAEFIPNDGVAFYVELRRGPEMLQGLTEPRVWTTLAEIAGQPADVRDAREWRERVRRVTRMDPEEAITRLMARGVAYVSTGPGGDHDAVMLCRPDTPPEELLRQWEARPLNLGEDLPRAYLLADNIAAFADEDRLVFGDAHAPDGLFRRVLALHGASRARKPSSQPTPEIEEHAPPPTDDAPASATAEPQRRTHGTLASDPIFARLSEAVGPHGDGLLFIRPPGPTATRPAAPIPFPGPLGDARTFLLAFERHGTRLDFRAAGDAPHAPGNPAPVRHLPRLPDDALAAIEFRSDLASLAGGLSGLPSGGVFEIVSRMPRQRETLERFLELLEPSTCLALGAARHADDAPPAPALALILTLRPGATPTALELFDSLAQSAVTVYDFFALARGIPPLPPRRAVADPDVAGIIDLRESLDTRIGDHVPLEICWAADGDALILATSRDWLSRVLAARRDDPRRLLSRDDAESKPLGNALIVQTRSIAGLGEAWLDWIGRHHPAALEERWWRERQPGADNDLLGIDVRNDRDNRRLEVLRVRPRGPSHGLLRRGDHIVGVGGRRFQTDQTIRETRAALAERPDARWVELLVERGGVTIQRRIAVPFFHPVEALRRIVALGGLFECIQYHDEASEAAVARGRLTIDMPAAGGTAAENAPHNDAVQEDETASEHEIYPEDEITPESAPAFGE